MEYAFLIAKTERYLHRHASTQECEGEVIPTISGLATYLQCGKSDIERWMQDTEKPEFHELVHRIWTEAIRLLHNGALRKEFPWRLAQDLTEKYDDAMSESAKQSENAENKGGTAQKKGFICFP